MTNPSIVTDRVLQEVLAERIRQDARWGEQHHPDGTSSHNHAQAADTARRACQRATERDAVTWAHILREEFWEVMAETDPARLRAELIQVGAVCAAWVADIDSRTPAEPTACGRCGTPFDPTDTRFDGRARHSLSDYCRRCVDRCHEATDAYHRCAVCQ